jgi:hypothetical protein
MKSFYNSTDGLPSEAATALCEKSMYFIKTLFSEYTEKGYSPREVSHLLITAVITLESGFIMEAMQKAGTLDGFLEKLTKQIEKDHQ